MDKSIESHNFNNIITFEAISSHDDGVTAEKQVALNGTVTEYPNGCADYDLSFATTGGKVTVATNGGDEYGVSINGLESGGHLCFDEPKTTSGGYIAGSGAFSLSVRNTQNGAEIDEAGALTTSYHRFEQ